MITELSIDVSGKKAVPKQELEDKLGYVARIKSVSPENREDLSFSGCVQIAIENKTSIFNGDSALILSNKDFREFLNYYNVKIPEYLVGKPVISIYTRNLCEKLCGLIPLNLDR
ncbi:hypothetical protein J4205_03815 [Candidatus Pacearchaeota archaeon]|nr:hypothetical protein [Candidatus Pacearchaeota archaeon]